MMSRLPSRDHPVRLRAAGRVRRATVVALDGSRIELDVAPDADLAGRAMLSFPSAGGGMLLPGRLLSAAGRVTFVADDAPQPAGQRREAYRLPVRCPVTVGPAQPGTADVALTRDLSVGGALLDGTRRYTPGSRLALTVALGDGAAALDAIVVRCEDAPDRSARRVAVAFVGLGAGEERELSRFIFAEQRKLLAAR